MNRAALDTYRNVKWNARLGIINATLGGVLIPTVILILMEDAHWGIRDTATILLGVMLWVGLFLAHLRMRVQVERGLSTLIIRNPFRTIRVCGTDVTVIRAKGLYGVGCPLLSLRLTPGQSLARTWIRRRTVAVLGMPIVDVLFLDLHAPIDLGGEVNFSS